VEREPVSDQVKVAASVRAAVAILEEATATTVVVDPAAEVTAGSLAAKT
jgi:hypothetical protein